MVTRVRIPEAKLERIAQIGGISLTWEEGVGADSQRSVQSPDSPALLREMAEAAFADDPDAFAEFVSENRHRIRDAALFGESGEQVTELLVLGYEAGIAGGSAACMNDLGALYYMGDLVEQDYGRARELYEMAATHGCLQSVINLGYVYEYGRTGEPDYAKAYECYALAAALTHSSEATYKLGDMYSRGRSVRRDLGRAHALWEHSLELASDYVEQAQPAVRIAKLLIDPNCGDWGMQRDPLRALHLFQVAEIGLRLDIADGQTYYRRRLQEAIEGQERARALLEEEGEALE